MQEPVGRSPATWSVLAVTGLVAALTCLLAATSVLTATGLLAVDPAMLDSDEGAALGLLEAADVRVAEGFAALVTVPLAVVCVLIAVGLARWRPWAREAVGGVYGLVGGLLLLFALGGLSGGSQDGPAVLAGSVVLLATVVLTASAPVREDFARRQVAREVRERRRLQQQREEADARDRLRRDGEVPRLPTQDRGESRGPGPREREHRT